MSHSGPQADLGLNEDNNDVEMDAEVAGEVEDDTLNSALAEMVSVHQLKEKHPAVYQILQKLAVGNFKNEDIIFAKALAKNLVEELEEEPDLETVIAHIIMQRFLYAGNSTLVLRNNDLFPRIMMEAFLNNIDFVINLGDKKEIAALRDKILAIADNKENKAQSIQELKALLNESFKNPQLIAALLPFYQAFINGAKTDKESASKRQAFVGQIAFPFVESFLAKSIASNDDEFPKLSKALRALKDDPTVGLYAGLIENLDKALPDFNPAPMLSGYTLASIEKMYHACDTYLKAMKEIQTKITAWKKYAEHFDIRSPLRDLFSELAGDLQEELDARNQGLFGRYREAANVIEYSNKLKNALADLSENYDALKKDLDVYWDRSVALEQTFRILATDFPKNTPEANCYVKVAEEILEARVDLEDEIEKANIAKEYDSAVLEDANDALTSILEPEINKSVKDKTPAQRMADLMRKAKTPEDKAKRDELLGRLGDEGADPHATTNNYRGRAASSAVRDFFSNIRKFQNPLLARSRSASDIAWMNGASPRTLEKLSPRSAGNSPRDNSPIEALKETPAQAPRQGWDRVNPKHLMSDVGYYVGLHRLTDMCRKSYEGVLYYLQSNPQPQAQKHMSILPPPPNSDDSRIPAILAASGYTAGFDAAKARAAGVPSQLKTGHAVEADAKAGPAVPPLKLAAK